MTNPEFPVPATIAVVIKHRRVLLVRRGAAPNRGYWGFPGGKIQFGETHTDAACRELLEETDIRGESVGAFAAADVFDTDNTGSTEGAENHYLLVAVRVRYVAGEPTAADDVDQVAWFDVNDLPGSCLKDVKTILDLARQRSSET